jgi:hypothetical protein
MSTRGDFIVAHSEASSLTRKKVTFVPSAKLTRKNVTFDLIWTSHNQDKRGFWQLLTRKNVTGEQGER